MQVLRIVTRVRCVLDATISDRFQFNALYLLRSADYNIGAQTFPMSEIPQRSAFLHGLADTHKAIQWQCADWNDNREERPAPSTKGRSQNCFSEIWPRRKTFSLTRKLPPHKQRLRARTDKNSWTPNFLRLLASFWMKQNEIENSWRIWYQRSSWIRTTTSRSCDVWIPILEGSVFFLLSFQSKPLS